MRVSCVGYHKSWSPKVPAYYHVSVSCYRVSMTLRNALLLDVDPQSWDTKNCCWAQAVLGCCQASDKFKIFLGRDNCVNFWGLASRKCCTGTLTWRSCKVTTLVLYSVLVSVGERNLNLHEGKLDFDSRPRHRQHERWCRDGGRVSRAVCCSCCSTCPRRRCPRSSAAVWTTTTRAGWRGATRWQTPRWAHLVT